MMFGCIENQALEFLNIAKEIGDDSARKHGRSDALEVAESAIAEFANVGLGIEPREFVKVQLGSGELGVGVNFQFSKAKLEVAKVTKRNHAFGGGRISVGIAA